MERTLVFADWLLELLQLHFLWIVYIFRGWIVGGIFPSTAAVYAVIRHWLSKKEPQSLSKLFKQYYMENFKVANILGWTFLSVTFITVMNFLYLPYYPGGLRMIMYSIIISFILIILVGWIYLFPIIVHYHLSISNYFIVIIKQGFTSILGTIMQLLFLGIYLYCVYTLPALLLLFGIVPFVLVQMAVNINIFQESK